MVHQTEQTPSYLDDTHLTEIVTRVVAAGRQDDGAAWVAVRDNLFHPQGGGQPADRGWLDGREVVPVRDAATGLVVLRAADTDVRDLDGLAVGDEVKARVDADLRLLHAALHTAGHLVEAAGRDQDWTYTGSNHFPGQARIEFTPDDPGPLSDAGRREEAAERLRAFVAAAVADGLPVTAAPGPDGLRLVSIGDLHTAPCGGTHVRGLADLADVAITAVKLKKGRLRASYSASHRTAG
ncbi:metal-dependent hydrolase [Actinomadura kijaniata]|uniref:metal-dependent hydrolase n=1 Tax=Actinomadura kijaniata TaxID=46161 RepID=UPI00082F7361|nr:metal-dependent hydrolase [Actinomadura kijaniata]